MRLIDADELLKYAVGFENGTQWVSVDIINDMPTVDTERHGWLISKSEKSPIAKCSECGMTYYKEDSNLNYCQICGVKFDKDGD